MTPLARRFNFSVLSCFVALLSIGCGSEKLTQIQVIPATGTTTLTATGQTAQFKAIASYISKHSNTQDVTSQVTWGSSQTSVATISASGLVTAGSTSGTSAITASLRGDAGVVVGTSNVAVSASGQPTPAVLTSIALIPGAQTIPVNQTVQFLAIGTLNNGATLDLTSQATWSSSNTKVATIGIGRVAGLARAVSSGQTTITAVGRNDDGSVVTGSAGFTVVGGGEPVQSVAITPGSQSISVDQSGQFIAIGTMGTGATENLTTQVAWSSSNDSIATVSAAGLATALSVGTTSITGIATNPDNSIATGTAQLAVTAAVGGAGPGGTPVLLSISILPGSPSVESTNETSQFIAIGTFSAAPLTQDVTGTVTWSSSDPKVATINASGLATGLNVGTTAILASFSNPDKTLVTGAASFTESATGTGPKLATLTIVPVGPNAATGQVASGVTAPIIHCGPGFANGSVCVGNFAIGSQVTLTATPGAGSTFSGWSKPCTPVLGTATCTLTVNDNDTVGAIFN